MRIFHLALLTLSMGALTLAQQPPDVASKETAGKPLLVVDSPGHEAKVIDFEFNADGSRLFTLGEDNTLQIWNAATSEHVKTIRFPWKANVRGTPTGSVRSNSQLTVAPDGKSVAVTVSTSEVNVRRSELCLVYLDTGRIVRLPGAGTGSVSNVTFSSNSDMLAASVWHDRTDNTNAKVCLWRDLKKGKHPDAPAVTLAKEWHYRYQISDLAFAPDGSRLAVAHNFQGGPVRLLNLKDLNAAPKEIDTHDKLRLPHRVTNLAWSPESSRVLAEVHDIRQSSAQPPRVMIWNADGLLLRTLKTSLPDRPVFRNENELLLLNIVRAEKKWKEVVLSQFDLQKNSQKEVLRCPLADEEAAVTRFTIAPNYQRLAISNRGHEIALLNLEPKAALEPLDAVREKPLFAVSNKRASRIAWTGNDRKKLIAGLDLKTAQPLSPEELKAESFGPLGKLEANHRGLVEITFARIKFTIFASGQDWILMTPEGYYTASPGGEKLVGWHVNNGYDKLASFYPFERFRHKLYRPDILTLAVEKRNVAQAVKIANALLPKAERPENDEVIDVEKLVPPLVELRIVDQSKLPLVQLKVSARAGAKEQPIRSLKLFVDGRPFNDPKATIVFPGIVQKDEREWTVELPPGKHQVAVFARSTDASSVSNEVTLDCRDPAEKPVMHVLTVGISSYADKSLNLQCADKDAHLLVPRPD